PPVKCSNCTSTTNFRRKRAHSPAVLGWARRRFPVKSRGLIMSLKLLELLRQVYDLGPRRVNLLDRVCFQRFKSRAVGSLPAAFFSRQRNPPTTQFAGAAYRLALLLRASKLGCGRASMGLYFLLSGRATGPPPTALTGVGCYRKYGSLGSLFMV